MAMPPCGTFHYAGAIPDQQARLGQGQWTLDDQSGAERVPRIESQPWWKFWKRSATPDLAFDRLRDDRLVGLQPTARISGSHVILSAASRHRATVCSVSLELDRTLLESLQAGDRIEFVRTATADIGVSTLREGELLWAAGAVTTIPLGARVQVRGGPHVDLALDEWPRKDTWVEVSIGGQTSRLHDGEELARGEYRVTLARTFKDGMPGQYENAAISRHGSAPHEAVVRAARILGSCNAGLTLTRW